MNFFGKYRGTVAANKDPLNLCRIQVSVPAIFGDERNSWAMPCVPYAGKDVGLFMIPPLHANVWVEFEGGDPDYPIWSGCFWGEKELPQNAQVSDPEKVQIFQTDGITLTLSNLEEKSVKKGIVLEVKSPLVEKPLKLIFNKEGIEINHGDVTTTKLLADTIELKNGNATLVTLAKDSIQLKEQAIEIKITQNSIEMICNPASIKLTTSVGITLTNSPSSAKLSASGVELSFTPAAIKIAASGVEANSGGLGVIKISPANVNVNNGALEVT